MVERVERVKNWISYKIQGQYKINTLDITSCLSEMGWCLYNKWRTNITGGEERTSLIEIYIKTSWVVEFNF
jgi:hypothetical protein